DVLPAKSARATLEDAAMKILPLLAAAVAGFAPTLVLPVPAAAAAAAAERPTMRTVDVPLHGARALASASPTRPFDLVGLHWRGSGSVEFRTRSLGGVWSAWHSASPEAEDLPNDGSAESRRTAGWKLGSPWWTGPSVRIEYRLQGHVAGLRAF